MPAVPLPCGSVVERRTERPLWVRAEEGTDCVATTRTAGPRRTEKVSEVLAREIVRDLRYLPPSTMLPSEAMMLEKYRVGRASLREALRLLETQGLIVILPGSGGGPMVAQADSIHYGRVSSLYYHMLGATYRDVMETRLIIEPMIARIVAERHDPVDVKVVQAFLDGERESPPDPGNRAGVYKAAADFHAMLIDMAGNPVLSLTARSYQDVLVERQQTICTTDAQPDLEHDHTAIAKAVVKGEGARAERLMREHMVRYVQHAVDRHPEIAAEAVDWR